LIVTLDVRECWELKAWILGFGSEAIVLDPSDLAEEIAQIARATANHYRPRGQRRPPHRARDKTAPKVAAKGTPEAASG
jgi:WYL domain